VLKLHYPLVEKSPHKALEISIAISCEVLHQPVGTLFESLKIRGLKSIEKTSRHFSGAIGDASLRDVLKSTAKLTLVEGPVLDKLVSLIGDHSSISKLRNHIAHSQWQAGLEPLSIQPVFGDVRQGKFKMFGRGGHTIEYTTDDLTRIHNLAIQLNTALQELLISDEFEQALVGRRSLHDIRFWMERDEN
jgi:hypothetical protein